jgi:WD40 repeat protein
MTVRWWDVGTGKEVRSLKLGPDTLYGAGISPDRRRFLYTSRAGDVVHLVDLSGGKETAQFRVPSAPYGWMSFSPDGRYAAGASANGWIYLWRLPDPPPPAKDGEVR